MKILMVCLGNICRSPMAEGVMRQKIKDLNLDFFVDSAGTSDFHVGEAPDKRAIACMKKHGIDISDLRARQIKPHDFHDFDTIFVMDRNNLRDTQAVSPDDISKEKVKLLLDYQSSHELKAVPDPYYGDEKSFEHVYELVSDAADNFLKQYSNL
jgi:protein-tyrosine phosphatase